MPSLRDKILSSIHTQKLAPRPRWQYVVGHFILWSICLLTLFAGAVSFALMLMEFDMPERVFVRWMDMQDNAALLLALPYLWLLGVILALSVGYFLFSHTGRGYRFHVFLVIGFLLGGSLLSGWILFSTHAVQWGEERFLRLEPHYRDFRKGMHKMMPRPEDGILPLRISRIDRDTYFGSDPAGHLWEVHLVCQKGDCGNKKIQLGKPILFHGMIQKPGKFEADSIFYPEKGRPFLPKQHP